MDAAASPLNALLAAQKNAFQTDCMPSHAARIERLVRLERLIETYGGRFSAAIDRDFGHRPDSETALLELAPLKAALRHTKKHLKAWMRPERRHVSLEFLTFRNRVYYQPLGVVGIMAPWNYPLMLTLGPLIDVLAAGNRALIKPSELLPETADLIQAAIGEHFAAEEVAVVTGGPEVAAAFAALPFDHLVFTGSTAVGRKVMAAAAANLTPLTLELGGKSPAIVTESFPLKKAARDLAFGKMMNAGQTCIAPDYVLVPRPLMEPLSEAIMARIAAFYPQKTAGRDYAGLVGARSLERLRKGIGEAQAAGCTILTHADALTGAGQRLAPTLVLDPPADCLLMREEIFGPVLPLVPYETLEEAIAFIRARPRPLALYLFSHDRGEQKEVLVNTYSGNVTLNGTLLHIAQNDLPFGGIGPSGLGAYHGRDGFYRFSHARGVADVRGPNPSRLAMPPYGAITRMLLRFLLR
ncbi:coniferyl aldehyde dehydrogenase [Allorhizobium sp. BGMRC 0089]|uniref:coniferyl aldehyde dehydrogenase n=1 Tax=Allorhizobium sonneratiae TaxID=2934936 RepID=UPI00203471E2|nr:coniferyl aldehyde dehydrogenase [Allorhizobium sonneratiae]MCM2294542.1 coniferyl aldehyde dehydrogenase [Allorhizobium sonneratiae]